MQTLSAGDAYVVTVRLDCDSQERLDRLRRRYFPPERNFLCAHLTWFHALSLEQCERVERSIAGFGWEQVPCEFLVPVHTGRGVAVPVRAASLIQRHAVVIRMLGADNLTRQDRQGLRPHVTIQNKVTREMAAATLAAVTAGFSPWSGMARGLQFWRYAGGPWEPRSSVDFTVPA